MEKCFKVSFLSVSAVRNDTETIKQLSEELLPCPFCGGDAEIEQYGNNRQSMMIACNNCGCVLESNETWIDENCQWNNRI